MDDGHCGLPADELSPVARKLLEVPADLVETALGLELQDGTVIADDLDGRRCVFLAGLYHAEREIAAKRADYFAAGTLVVWDVDLLSPDVIKSYNVNDPDTPKTFRRGEIAEAEPAVPGWQIAVDELFS